jgi:hypothetical protein
MAERRLSEWRELLENALLELDTEKLPEKIARAEMAIYRRSVEANLEAKTDLQAKAERQALDDGLRSPSILKKRHFPGWNKVA